MRKAFLFVFLLSAVTALAQNTCPSGLVNDSLPGKCGLYTDADGNNVCDLSETPSAQDQDPGIEEANSGDTVSEDQSPEPETEDGSLGNNQSVEPIQNGEAEISSSLNNNTGHDPGQTPAPAPRRINYHFWKILVITGILGLATELWLKRNSKDTLVLQTAWNWLLFLSFLASALSGLYFVMPYDKRPFAGFNFSYWHTVTGIIFIAVGLYHTIRRFTCMLGKKAPCPNNGNCKEAKKQPE